MQLCAGAATMYSLTLVAHPRAGNCSSSLMNLCFSDERGEGSDGERYTHRERDRVVSGGARRAAPRSRSALRTGSPLGSLSFRRHKARGSGLKTTRARRALREYLLTKVAVVLCISNSTSALCHVVEHRWRIRDGPLSAQLAHQCCASQRGTRSPPSAGSESERIQGEAVEDRSNADYAGKTGARRSRCGSRSGADDGPAYSGGRISPPGSRVGVSNGGVIIARG